MKTWLRRLRQQSDEGSALVLALIVTVVIGIVLTTALSFAGTGLSITTKVRDLRNQTQYLQGAVDGAINQIRGSTTAGGFRPDGVTPFGCPDYVPPTPTNDLGADSSAYKVTCTPKPLTSGSVNQSVPTFAVLTLGPENRSCSGDPTCVGFNDLSGNNTLQVFGGIYSHGDISIAGASKNTLIVEGSVYGEGAACDAAFISPTDLDGVHCPNYDDSVTQLGVDPNYAAGIGDDTSADHAGHSALALSSVDKDPLPTCTGGVAYFTPGYYSVIPDLLTANPDATGCSHFSPSSGLEVFQPSMTAGTVTGPGYYYFDFAATGGDASKSTWVPNHVIGGVPTALSGIDWTKPCDETTFGVQFEFGGASSINFPSGGQVGVCGPSPNPTHAHEDVSFYGLSGSNTNAVDSAASTEQTLPATQDPTNTNILLIGPQFTPEDTSTLCTLCPVPDAKDIGGGVASVDLGSNDSAGLKYSNFGGVPAGSRISSVGVCVADNPDAHATAQVNVTLPAQAGGSAVTKTASLSPSTSACPSPNRLYTLSAANMAAVLPDAPQWREANQLQVTYKVTEANHQSGTSTIDGLALDISYSEPALEKLKPQNDQPGGSTCASVTTTLDFLCLNAPANSVGAMVTTGTVYTPTVDLVVLVQNGGKVLFQRGVIAYSLTANDSASFKQSTPPFRIPGGTPGLGRLVLFEAYAGSDVRVRACVEYVDNVVYADGSTGPQFQGYQVKVRHWDVLHGVDSLSPTCA